MIAPDIILTAGHCNPPLTQPVLVKVGRYSYSQDDDSETFSIKAIHRHPDYQVMSWDEDVNDYNIFKLNGFSKHRPILINRSPGIPKNGAMVRVVGMGSTSADPQTFMETASDVLQEVELNVISNDECSQYEDPSRNVRFAGRIFDNMICTRGGKHNQRDGCAFDSGSPLIVTENGQDVVTGMVSWGISCADPVFPGVNSRVSYVTDWIDQIVCELSEADVADLTDFGCKQKHGWLYSLSHPKARDSSNKLTMEVGSTKGAQIAHHVLLLGLVAVAVAVAVARTLRAKRVESAEQVPLHKSDMQVQKTYETL